MMLALTIFTISARQVPLPVRKSDSTVIIYGYSEQANHEFSSCFEEINVARKTAKTHRISYSDVSGICAGPNGSFYATHYFDSKLNRWSFVKGKQVPQLIEQGNDSSPSWNPQTDILAFIRDHCVVIRSTDGATKIIVDPGREVRSMSPKYDRAWSSCFWVSANQLMANYRDPYILSKPEDIYLLKHARGITKKQIIGQGQVILASPIGSQVLVTLPEDRSLVYWSSIREKTRPRKIGTFGSRPICLDPTGRRIAFIRQSRGRDALWTKELSSGTERLVLIFPKGIWGPMCWI
jgi:hypothetical protein